MPEIGLDITRRFNQMDVNARAALQILVHTYDNRNLHVFNAKTLKSLLSTGKSILADVVEELLRYGFLVKSRNGYKLNRQKADTLITMGILDSEKNLELPPMGPINESEEKLMINEDYMTPEYLDKFIAQINTKKSMNPEDLSEDGFEISLDEPDKDTRFKLIEIVDRSTAGRKIEPPMWIIEDSATSKVYLIAQDGLRFTNPDASAYIGLKQLKFLKKHEHFVLGTFSSTEEGIEKARQHASKFFDLNLNNNNIYGYLPHRVGDKFWVVQCSKTGLYCVLKKGKLPAYTSEKRKVVDLTHDEAIGVFVASEKNSKEKKPKLGNTTETVETGIDQEYEGENFKSSIQSYFTNL